MKCITILMVGILLLINVINLEANWEFSISYQYDNRGYRWEEISTSPHKGIVFEFGYQFSELINHFNFIGVIEYISQTNSFDKNDLYGVPLLSSEEMIQRIGVTAYLNLDYSFISSYIGVGGGIEFYDKEFILKEGSERIQWVGVPTNRMESNPYLNGVVGVQTNIIKYFNPFFDVRYYQSMHSNKDYTFDLNKIQNSFFSLRIGVRVIL
ncbi:MAG: hypothetical protein ACFFDN_32200 [Candidatus Hodarchaeota archaeon]